MLDCNSNSNQTLVMAVAKHFGTAAPSHVHVVVPLGGNDHAVRRVAMGRTFRDLEVVHERRVLADNVAFLRDALRFTGTLFVFRPATRHWVAH